VKSTFTDAQASYKTLYIHPINTCPTVRYEIKKPSAADIFLQLDALQSMFEDTTSIGIPGGADGFSRTDTEQTS
jgi:hypothetical protein